MLCRITTSPNLCKAGLSVSLWFQCRNVFQYFIYRCFQCFFIDFPILSNYLTEISHFKDIWNCFCIDAQ